MRCSSSRWLASAAAADVNRHGALRPELVSGLAVAVGSIPDCTEAERCKGDSEWLSRRQRINGSMNQWIDESMNQCCEGMPSLVCSLTYQLSVTAWARVQRSDMTDRDSPNESKVDGLW